MTKDVMLVTGAGQISMAIARRTGSCRKIVLGDKNSDHCMAVAELMNKAGFDVEPVTMDLSSKASIVEFITDSTFLADGGATASYYYGPLQP